MAQTENFVKQGSQQALKQKKAHNHPIKMFSIQPKHNTTHTLQLPRTMPINP
jgi:hypothetical protein